MKTKILAAILASLFVISVVSVGIAANDNASEKGKEKAKAPALEKIEFIHWKKNFAKPPCDNDGVCDPDENPSCGDCKSGDDEEPSAAACYAFIGQYGKRLLKWPADVLPVQYVINPEVPEGLSVDLVKNALADAAAEWDFWAGPELFRDSYVVSSQVSYGVRDGRNAIVFDNYLTPGVIAVTSVWYNPATKAIVEFDIKFDTDWTWGDATDPETPTVMDVQNIAVHELGHGVGLADVYDEADCSEVTMYGLSDYGETKKRDLEEPDVTGITTLYGQ